MQAQNFEKRCWDETIHQEIAALCARRAEKWKTNTALSGSPHIVNGLAFCARCGKRLYPMMGSKYRGCRCRNGHIQGRDSCPKVTVRAEVLEDVVVRDLE